MDMKVLISHASKDSTYVGKIVELLEDIGLTEEHIVCSSIPGYGIPLGKDIYDWLAQQFREYELHVLFVLSKNYYASIACQNEMGAAWVLKTKYDTILLPGFEFADIKGAVNPNQISIKLDGDEGILKQHLNELKDQLVAEFQLPMLSASKWERHRETFMTTVSSIQVPADDADNTWGGFAPFFEEETKLTQDAEKLLVAGAKDPSGRILAVPTLGGSIVSANGEMFCYPEGGPRLEAIWMGVIDELEDFGFIQAASHKRQVFILRAKDMHMLTLFKKQTSLQLRQLEWISKH